MASISNRPNGRRRVQFTGANGKRQTIRLGKVSLRYAESVKVKVEDLVSASLYGHAPRDDTSRWLAGLDDRMQAKLVKVGLIARDEPDAEPQTEDEPKAQLGAFIDDYIERRTDVKPSTRLCYERARRYLVEYFREDCPLDDITPGDAEDWRLHLLAVGLAENTVRRSCGLAKQFFGKAVRSKLIAQGPFEELVAAVKPNRKRDHFVSREDAEKVLAACPDAQWRLLFALARYGGVRVPSEPMRLRWVDVDWATSRMTVSSPKTEHHEGHESRVVPMFPELLSYLQEAFEQADEGAEFCITRYRDGGANLRTQLHRIIKRAGLKPWPKLWHNLRATRQTELEDQFPGHVVSTWIGNSQQVAARHYLQVTDEHYRKATQNPTQKMHETCRNASKDSDKESSEPEAETVVSSASFESSRKKTTPYEMQGVSEEWALQDSNL